MHSPQQATQGGDDIWVRGHPICRLTCAHSMPSSTTATTAVIVTDPFAQAASIGSLTDSLQGQANDTGSSGPGFFGASIALGVALLLLVGASIGYYSRVRNVQRWQAASRIQRWWRRLQLQSRWKVLCLPSAQNNLKYRQLEPSQQWPRNSGQTDLARPVHRPDIPMEILSPVTSAEDELNLDQPNPLVGKDDPMPVYLAGETSAALVPCGTLRLWCAASGNDGDWAVDVANNQPETNLPAIGADRVKHDVKKLQEEEEENGIY